MSCPTVQSRKLGSFDAESSIHGTIHTMEKSVKERTIFVLDWDDTLNPSSWLQQLGLLPKTREDIIFIEDDIKKILMHNAEKVIELLERCRSYGPIFIVTAAEKGWIELSCSLYMPSLTSILAYDGIHLVSARTWYEGCYGYDGDVADWKNEVIKIIATECFTSGAASLMDPTSGYFNLVAIGDSMVEIDACHRAADTTPFTLAKTLKFISKPHVEDLVQQLDLAYESIHEMCIAESTIDVRLTKSLVQSFRKCR